ncbi:MAG: quercetin 2,3-dioxygenase [Myxococcales bacterium]|nr:quercetin 2,3-dioxygenase [Myxococcales bacterium]
MLTFIPAAERGHTKIDWLDSHHTFSFGEYHDPAHMGFRALRVVNDDRVAPGRGFPTHGHADMEIISYVLEGALEHKDSLGTGSVIRPGDVQRMSAGTGVRHSEFNASRTEPVHFLQIWIIPDRRGHAPGYEQKAFSEADRRGRLRLVGSPDGREGSVSLHQDVALYVGLFDEGETATLALRAGRHGFVHVATGAATVNGRKLVAGDGLAVSEETALQIEGHGAEVLVFDLA